MPQIVVMPKMGLTATEAELSSWLVEIEQEVSEGDLLCEIETDKITNEVESPASGVLLKRIEPGVVVPVGEPIAVLGTQGEDVSGIRLYGADKDRVAAPAAGPEAGAEERSDEPAGGRVKSSPAARQRAQELGVSLEELVGSGPGGRVTLEDVEAASESTGKAYEEPSRLRRAIARSMSLSASVPQFSLERDVVVGDLAARLEDYQPRDETRPGIADAIGVALCRGLRGQPRFLRSWVGDRFEIHRDVNVGIAVALEEGLIVPVMRGADRLTLAEFAVARRDLQERVREGRLSSAEASGAVFTLSNLGPLGVDRFTALVNPPESGILAVGRVHSREGRRRLTLTLSADHRVVDGADGARLLAEIAHSLEDEAGVAGLVVVTPGTR
jgi:pyruvate dehydrogenase E2 component (dihydrolipoamide acetyltransferase)